MFAREPVAEVWRGIVSGRTAFLKSVHIRHIDHHHRLHRRTSEGQRRQS
jgi:hypothetical protein